MNFSSINNLNSFPSRIDIDGPVAEVPQTFLRNSLGKIELPAELQKVIKNQFGSNPPLVVEKDKIIINDHVINSNDPTIIDVLSKHEQGHLFGKHDGRPMAIEIVAGLPMKYPNQVRIPGGSEVNKDEINYVPTQYDDNNGRVPPPPRRPGIGVVPGSPRGQPLTRPAPPQRQQPKSKRPQPPISPQKPRVPPPRRQPPPPGKPRRPPPKRPVGLQPTDSSNQFSINNEVKVKPPPQFNNKPPRPGSQQSKRPPQTNNRPSRPPPPQSQGRPIRPPPNPKGPQRRPVASQGSSPNRPPTSQSGPSRPPPPLQGSPNRPPVQGNPNRPPPQSRPNRPLPVQGGPNRPPPLAGSNRPPPQAGPNRPQPQGSINRPPPRASPNRPPLQTNPNRPPPPQGSLRRPPIQGSLSRPTQGNSNRPPPSQGNSNRPPPPQGKFNRPSLPQGRPPHQGTSNRHPPQGTPNRPSQQVNSNWPPPGQRNPGARPSQPQTWAGRPVPANRPTVQPPQGNGGSFANRPSGQQLGVPPPPTSSQNVPQQTVIKIPPPPPRGQQQPPVQTFNGGFVTNPAPEGFQLVVNQPEEPQSAQAPLPTQTQSPSVELARVPQSDPIPQTTPSRPPPRRQPTTPRSVPVPSIPQFLGGNGILPQPSRPGQNDRKDSSKSPQTNQIQTPNVAPYPPRRPVPPKPKVPRPPPTTQEVPATIPPPKQQRPNTRRPPPPRPTRRPQGTTPGRPYTPIDEPALNPAFGNRIPPSSNPNQPSQKTERRPYNDNNPNKARKPRPTPAGASFQVDADGEVRDVTLTGPFGKGVIQTAVDPSFTVEPGYPQRATKLVNINKGKSDAIDYEGWRTDAEVEPSVLRPTSSFFDLTLSDKEAPKTVTYANEWVSVNDNSRTQIRFTPQQKPELNTNFPREWTTRNNEVIRPTKASGFSRTLRPYQTPYNDNWRVPEDVTEAAGFGEKIEPAPAGNEYEIFNQENPNKERQPYDSTNRERQPFESANTERQPYEGTNNERQPYESANRERQPYPTDTTQGEEETIAPTQPIRTSIPDWAKRPTAPARPTRPTRPRVRPTWPQEDQSTLAEDQDAQAGEIPSWARPDGQFVSIPAEEEGSLTPTDSVVVNGRPNWSQIRPNGQFISPDSADEEGNLRPTDASGVVNGRPNGSQIRPNGQFIPSDEEEEAIQPGDPTEAVVGVDGRPNWSQIRPYGQFVPTEDDENDSTLKASNPTDPTSNDVDGSLDWSQVGPNEPFVPTDAEQNFFENEVPTAQPGFRRPNLSPNRPGGQFESNEPNVEPTLQGPTNQPRPLSPKARRPTRPPTETFAPPRDQATSDTTLDEPSNTFGGSVRGPLIRRPTKIPFNRRPGFGPPTSTGQGEVVVGRPSNRPVDPFEDSANNLLGIPEVEPSSPEERPGRVPFVKPIRPKPAKNPQDRGDDFIEVIEGTFEPKGPILPVRTNDLPFTTNIVVRNSVGGRNPIVKTAGGGDVEDSRVRTTSFRPTPSRTRIKLPTNFIRPTTRRQETTREPPPSTERVQIGGLFPFRPTTDQPAVRRPDVAGNGNERNEAIVESIHGGIPSAEDSDPETRCQNTCGVNENCQINADGGIDCKCRPGFGRKASNLQCESKCYVQFRLGSIHQFQQFSQSTVKVWQ